MTNLDLSTPATIGIVILATAGVIIRPWKIPEAVWAVAGAALLILFGLLPVADGIHAVAKGTDVYFFLAGMMLLSEVARYEGLFDFLAGHAARRARGSAPRLFLLIYAVGTVVTIFMSNDATAVVLTPAVFAAVRAARAKPLPYVYICAFIANAASFVLPISNPANLVLFQSKPPALGAWLQSFAVPSLVAIGVTFLVLRWTQRAALRTPIEENIATAPLSGSGIIAGIGIGLTALVLIGASTMQIPLGLPTFITGVATFMVVVSIKRKAPWPLLGDISWAVIPLVAGLFVMVESLNRMGFIKLTSSWANHAIADGGSTSALGIGALVAVLCNLMNNLPAGLIAALTLQTAQHSTLLRNATLVGVDLGPNLSITGSLATILWLTALRREGETVGAWQFFKLGLLLMPLALVPALASLFLLKHS
jgi:arsenical pump membrane protein